MKDPWLRGALRLCLATLLLLLVPAAGALAADDGPITDAHREAAEAYWLMMSRMQGMSGTESPVIKAIEERGVQPAPMLERDLRDGSGARDSSSAREAGAMAGHHGPKAEGADGPRIWTEAEYLTFYNRLGTTPPPNGYQEYLRRQGVLDDGGSAGSHAPVLDTPEKEARAAAQLGFHGGKVKRGRDHKAPAVEITVHRGAKASLAGLPARPALPARPGATVRDYDVVAMPKDIYYTRFGDHDPKGMLYVLRQDRARVEACEGFECGHDPLFFGSRAKDPAVLSPQPLVIRANVGDTVRIRFTNEIGRRASLHVHKAFYDAADSAGSDAGHNPDTTVASGESITYTWEIPNEEWAEGIYYFYSHADPRYQVAHGLYGALIVEPAGSRYLDTETGEPLAAGWGAIIDNVDPAVRAFREYTVFFQDRIQLETPNGEKPVDLWTGVPDPGGKGISYRTAPFFNMMNLFLDESMAYSAYAFGDYSTPHPRWYVGDPMRMRVVHGGSGEHHVYHNHAHRWRVNPLEEDDNLTLPSKAGEHDKILSESTRIDSQTMGPGEVFDVEMEGGAGGVQRTVGDVLFHCHIIEHVVEGMWSYHRIFNTFQDDLAPLPDRQAPPRAVDSIELLRRAREGHPAVVRAGGTFYGQAITEDNFQAWLEWLLPPAGVPDEELIVDPEHGNRTQNKANEWDWIVAQTDDGPLALGEPYDWFFGQGWPAEGEGVGCCGAPDERPKLLFNPDDGRLAFPQIKPHLGRRPPFAAIRENDPDTQGTAYLGKTLPADAASESGHPYGSGLVPAVKGSTLRGAGQPTNVRHYDVTAIQLPIVYNDYGDTDPTGMIFALADDVPEIRAGDKPPEPLILRSRVGEGVQIRLRSALPDAAAVDHHSKVGMHIHLVQYDVQSSDGAVAGLNYETSVRPSLDENGDPIEGRRACGVWDPTDCGPLTRQDEVVHTTWFADVELGTVYWHDHSKLIVSLPHGLFGALIVEPEGAEFRDRETGEDKYVADDDGRYSSTNGRTGTRMADIVVPDDVIDPRTGTKRRDFREFFFGQSDALRLHGTGLRFSALEHGESRKNPEKGFPYINNQSQPFSNRLAERPDESLVYSSFVHGDPAPADQMFRAYIGDPVSLRIEAGGTSSIHPFQLHGHRWLFQRGDTDDSPYRDFVVNGQSEAFSFDLEGGAGGLTGHEGDYLYFDADMDHRREGAWNIFRVHDTRQADVQPLPDRDAPPEGVGFPETMIARGLENGRPPKPDGPGDPGPPGAPVRRYRVVAIEQPIPYDSFGTPDRLGKMFVLAKDEAAVRSGEKPTEPLCIRANAGEVVEIELTNKLATAHAGLHASMVGYDVFGSDGAAVGYNPDSTVAPGETITYRWYADAPLGTVYLYDPASLDHTRHGLFGGLFVEPAGSTWSDPKTGGALASGCAADVTPGDGTEPYREYGIFFQDGVDQIRYRVAINYRTARRKGASEVLPGGPGGVVKDDRELTVHDSDVWGDPVTPVFRAYEGDRVIVRLLQPAYEDHHVFHLHGHSWFLEPGDPTSQHLSNITLSVGTTYDLELIGGARAGDHPFHCHIMDHKKMGMWGLFRVFDRRQPDLEPLPEARPADPAGEQGPGGLRQAPISTITTAAAPR